MKPTNRVTVDHRNLFKKFPDRVVNDAIHLRAFRRSDAPAYQAHLLHPLVRPHIPDTCLPHTLEQAEQDIQYLRDLFNRQRSVYWAIATRADDVFIGSCGFEHWNTYHRKLELAYDLHPDHWRKGYMSAALRTILDVGFMDMGAHRVEAFVPPNNTASIHLLQHTLGFTCEGVLRGYRFFKDAQRDILSFSLLSTDPRPW